MDVLYIFKNSEDTDNLELKLSLRSLEANGKNIDKVFIVGDLPDWIQNVEYINVRDNYTRETNAFLKTLAACRLGISDDFLLMNDDFFMMKPFDSETYPYYVMGNVVSIDNPSRWQMVQNKTLNLLQSKGIDRVKDFRVHCPIRYNREKFLSLSEYVEKVKNENIGYSPRLLYGNLFVDETIECFDCKLWSDNNIAETKQGCISSKDGGFDVLNKIEKIFNKSSKYEKKVLTS